MRATLIEGSGIVVAEADIGPAVECDTNLADALAMNPECDALKDLVKRYYDPVFGIRYVKITPCALQCQIVRPGACAPSRARAEDAGFDLAACVDEPVVIPSGGGRALIPTGVCLSCPPTHYLRVAPRSGLALRHGIIVMAGVGDASYRGEYGVVLLNTGSCDFTVRNGDRIAQIVVTAIMATDQLQFEVVADLPVSSRGGAGFGSSGV
jgi:dUTP pyrophosphatase